MQYLRRYRVALGERRMREDGISVEQARARHGVSQRASFPPRGKNRNRRSIPPLTAQFPRPTQMVSLRIPCEVQSLSRAALHC